MTINSRIFSRLHEMKMSQKEFSNKTGIAESTISEWKTKNNTPSADKIAIICKTLNVSSDWLLTGQDYVDKDIEFLINVFRKSDSSAKERILGYAQALNDTILNSE